MTGLTPVSFRKGREHAPRLSPPRVPGRRDERFWTPEEDEILRDRYPDGGVPVVAALLPNRHARSIYARAHGLGLRTHAKRTAPYVKPDDETIKERWAKLEGRGSVSALADELGVPRHWLSGHALKLGLTVPHKKEPPWTIAELALMSSAPLHDLKRSSRYFASHGFARSPAAIGNRAKRMELSRRDTRETWSAGKAAQLLGVDPKVVTAWILEGQLKATRREDMRLPQQGGNAFAIRPADLRRFIIDRLERIDIRKVEKFAFVALIAGDAAEPEARCS